MNMPKRIDPSTLRLADCIRLLYSVCDDKSGIGSAIAKSGEKEELMEYWTKMDKVKSVAEALSAHHKHKQWSLEFETGESEEA